LGIVGGVAVVAAVLTYGSYTALEGNDNNVAGADESSRPQASSDGWSEGNVREVQTKLRDAGLYFGEIDGAYSSELAAALGRYQIRNGLPITAQLDFETSKALGAKPAVAASTPSDQARTSETWERLLKSDREFPGKTVWRAPSPSIEGTGMTTGTPPQSTPAATAEIAMGQPASATPATGSTGDISTERLRDYVGAFVLAGLDPQIGPKRHSSPIALSTTTKASKITKRSGRI